MKKIVLSALAVASLAGTTLGQNIGPSLGTVEMRWVERSMPAGAFNGGYVLGAGAVSAPVQGGAAPAMPTAAQVTQQDSTVVLLLQVKVTGNVGTRGLAAAGFDIVTNQTTGGGFTTAIIGGSNPALNPRGGAFVGPNTAGQQNLGFNVDDIVDGLGANANRGVVAPFRGVANNNSANGPATGLGNAADGFNTLSKVTLGAQGDAFIPGSGDPLAGQYNLLGSGEWATVYCAIYSISDVSTARDIVFSIRNSPADAPNPTPTDYGFRTWTGGENTQNGDLDLWALSPATSGFTPSTATFTVSIVPAPGAAALLGLGGLIAARRRRTA